MAEVHTVICDGCGKSESMVDLASSVTVTGTVTLAGSHTVNGWKRNRPHSWYAPAGWREEQDHDFCSNHCHGIWLQGQD